MPTENSTAPKPSWWQRRVVSLIVRQLSQGVTPSRLALAIAIGGAISVNPFLGTTTLGCLAAGMVFRLNQPVLQIANILAAPLQLALIIPWVRAGEWMYRASPIPIAPSKLAGEFSADPWLFIQRFGLSGLYAATVWLLVAPFLGAAIYFAIHPVLRALARRLSVNKGSA